MSTEEHRVSVIIPNWNGRRWLPGCLEALNRQTFREFEIVVVDNGSRDDSLSFLRDEHADVKIIQLDTNLGFAHAVNMGIASSHSEYMALLNNDTEARPEWLGSLVAALDASDASVGSATSRMLQMSSPETIDNAGDVLTWQGAAYKRGHGEPATDYAEGTEVFSACGGAALYRRSFLYDIGGFDDDFFAYLEDVDVGLRGQLKGYRCLYVPTAEVLHAGHGSDLPDAHYVRLITRNRLRLLFKNLPARILLRHIHSICYGQWYFFVVCRKPFASIWGTIDFIRSLPGLRKSQETEVSIGPDGIENLLEKKIQGPGIVRMIVNRVSAKSS